MSEETEVQVAEPPESPEKPEKQEKEERHPVKQSSGSTGAFLAVLIALSVLGAVYYLWQQQEVLRNDVSALEGSIDRLVKAIEERHQSQQAQLDTLVDHRHPVYESKEAELEHQLLQVRSKLSKERSDWTLAEVEYLVRIADHRLTLDKDPQIAIAALTQAVQKITLMALPALEAPAAQLNQDIAALNAVSLPDIAATTAVLAELSAQIPQWPFTAGASSNDSVQERVAEQPRESQSWLNRALSKIWGDIKGLVTIRRSDEVSRPLMDTEQRYFLQQNLRLKLESARLALLGGHNQPYRDSLNEAILWLEQYYDTASPLVSDAIHRIQRLAGIDLEPALPSLKQSLSLLQKAIIEIQVQQSTEELPGIVDERLPHERSPAANSAVGDSTETSSPEAPSPMPIPPSEQTAEPETPPSDMLAPQSATSPADNAESTPPAPASPATDAVPENGVEMKEAQPPSAKPLSPSEAQPIPAPGTTPQTPPSDVPGGVTPPQGIRL